jgi:hypothetical protein
LVDATRAIVWVIMLAKANERRQKMLDVKARVVVVMVTDRQTVDDLYHARRHAAREARGREGSRRALGFLLWMAALRSHGQTAQDCATRNCQREP